MNTINIQNITLSGKSLSVSTAAWLLHYFDNPRHWPVGQREQLMASIEQVCAAFHEQLSSSDGREVRTKNKDPRTEQILALLDTEQSQSHPVKLFSDYEALLHAPLSVEGVQLVDAVEDATFLFTMQQIKNFLAMPLTQRVNQFPYESGLIRKDLLLLTIRRYCYVNGIAPDWWLPCFDLSTEFHLFAEEHIRRGLASLPNRWIIKPAQGTRGMGHRITDDTSSCGVHHAAVMSAPLADDVVAAIAGIRKHEDLSTMLGMEPVSYDGADRVAQLLVDKPLLVRRRKFDMRYFVFIKSFEPFIGYSHQLCYSRLAVKDYDTTNLGDPLVTITVCAYDEDETVASLQERVLYSNMQAELDTQYGVGMISWDEMRTKTDAMLADLFRSSGRSIGCWPNSSAYYSVDVIYTASDEASAGLDSCAESNDTAIPKLSVDPKLIEVNFLGDWHGLEVAVGDDLHLYHQWINDLIRTLTVGWEGSDLPDRLHPL